MTAEQGADMERKMFSTFAVALRSLLDDHGTMRRSEWAEVLGVSEAAVSQWVTDAAIPRAENLRAIINALVADRRVPSGPIDAFEELMRRPATEVSPNGERMKPTIAHYVVKPLREAFLRTLETLPPEGQEVVLLDGAARCRQVRTTPVLRHSIEARRRLQFESLIEQATNTPIAGIATLPAHLPTADVVADPELEAQCWMQEVLLAAATGSIGATTSSIARPLSIARRARIKDYKSRGPIDQPSIWIEANAVLLRGVRSTIAAAELSGNEFVATQGHVR